MSDDDGGADDYGGDFEDLGVADEEGPAEEGLAEEDPENAGPEAEAEADEDGLEAAGTDEEEEEGEEGAEVPGEADIEGAETAPSSAARPERTKVDPLLRISNKPRLVVVVPPDERTTDHRLQKPEAAYLIAMRAQQIARTATHFAEGSTSHDPVVIAFEELFQRRCPLIHRRPVGTGPAGELMVEEWSPRVMALPPLTSPKDLQ
jgi:DNA-directed RNA polymerase subunit K/omega